MAKIDWEVARQMAGNNFKDYAPSGVYTVKVEGIVIHEVGTNGSVAQDFKFAETDQYQFPKATHWLSFKNDNWRVWHNKCLMELLGASEDAAKKAVETAEDKSSKEDKIKAYTAIYERLLAKKPEVEIEVWQDGKYGRADFTNTAVRMSRPEQQPQQTEVADLGGAQEVSLDIDLPF